MKYSTRLFSVTCPATTRPPSTAKASFRRLLGTGHIRQNFQAKQSNKVNGPSILRFASRKTEGKAIVSSNDHFLASKAVPRRLTTAAAIVSNSAFNKRSCKLHSHQQCHLWHTASPSAVTCPCNHQARTRQAVQGPLHHILHLNAVCEDKSRPCFTHCTYAIFFSGTITKPPFGERMTTIVG